MHRRTFSNNSLNSTPRSAPSQPAQQLNNQSMPSFIDRKNPFQSQSSDYQQPIMPTWNSFMSSVPLPSPPAEMSHSEYFWGNGPSLPRHSTLDHDTSDTEYSEDYCSLFPIPPNQTIDKKDDMSLLAGLAYTTNGLDHPSFNPGYPLNHRGTSMPTSDAEESQSQTSDSETPHHKSEGRLLEEVRVVHNQVEQRYRHRVRDNINALWNVIPESSTTIQPSKAVVLKRAKEHILELQQHARREKRKKEALEAKVQMLEHFLAEQPSTRGLKAQNVKYSVV